MTYSRNDVRPYEVFNKNEEEVATKSDMKHLKSNKLNKCNLINSIRILTAG